MHLWAAFRDTDKEVSGGHPWENKKKQGIRLLYASKSVIQPVENGGTACAWEAASSRFCGTSMLTPK